MRCACPLLTQSKHQPKNKKIVLLPAQESRINGRIALISLLALSGHRLVALHMSTFDPKRTSAVRMSHNNGAA